MIFKNEQLKRYASVSLLNGSWIVEFTNGTKIFELNEKDKAVKFAEEHVSGE